MEINEILRHTIDNLKEVTNTEGIVGKAILTEDGTVILPILKLSAGYIIGGGGDGKREERSLKTISAGVGGGGVTVSPVGFLVCGKEKRFISVDKTTDSKFAELIKTAMNSIK